MSLKHLTVSVIDPESALVSKAVKAPKKNKILIEDALAENIYPNLSKRITDNGGDLKFFYRIKTMEEDDLKKIRKKAAKRKLLRKDIRYLRVMAFLHKKGFLIGNTELEKFYVPKIWVEDAIWVGKNLEPRVLEVLPAAFIRLPKEVRFKGKQNEDLLKAAIALKEGHKIGPGFYGVKFKKYKTWIDLELADKRTKPLSEQTQMKSFRLTPKAIKLLDTKKKETGLSYSKIIEQALSS